MERRLPSDLEKTRYLLLISICAWIALLVVKGIFTDPIKLLPLPTSIFWIASGVVLSIPCFSVFTGIRFSLSETFLSSSKGVFLALSSAIFGALAYGTFLFIDVVNPTLKKPFFFAFAPFLTWVIFRMYFSQQKSRLQLIGVLIIALGIGISIYPTGNLSILHLSSLLLAGFACLAFLAKRSGASPLTVLLFLSTIGITLSSVYLLLNWPKEIPMHFENIYSCIVGGVVLGLSLLAFLEAFTRSNEKQRVLLMMPCFVACFAPNLSVLKGSFPFLIAAILVLPACNLIKALNGKNELPITH